MIIALCGFMGSGKSTIAKLLAKEKNFKVIEMDEELEKNENMSIADIFKYRGEGYFRQLETRFLTILQAQITDSNDNIILSLGGGVVTCLENRILLKRFAKLVCIDTPFDICYARIVGSNRPIVRAKTRDELFDLYSSRLEAYSDSDVIIDGADSLNNIINEIIKRLKL